MNENQQKQVNLRLSAIQSVNDRLTGDRDADLKTMKRRRVWLVFIMLVRCAPALPLVGLAYTTDLITKGALFLCEVWASKFYQASFKQYELQKTKDMIYSLTRDIKRHM